MKRTTKIFAWLVIIHSSLFILFWGTNTSFYTDTNNFLANLLGAKLNYIGEFQAVSLVFFLWSLVVLVLRWRYAGPIQWQISLGDWLFAILGLIYLVFFYGSFYMLFHESPAQMVRLVQMLAYFRVLLDPLLLLGAAALATGWIRRLVPGWKRAAPILVLLVILWSLALAFPPTPVLRGALPDKPLLIAHRGADALAPENTLAASRLAAEMGAFGQETDVQMSVDGQLFLMHDDTLTRTTDVAGVYPERAKDRAGTFTWEELSHLDAGSWFIKEDPFDAIRKGTVRAEQAAGFAGEPIPTFQEWLSVIRDSGQILLYDVKSSEDEPESQADVYEASLDAIAEAGVGGQAWILADPEQVALVKSILPGAKLAAGVVGDDIPTAVELSDAGYRVINAEYTLPVNTLKGYKKSSFWVNIYTVDEAWQYSRLWLLGADSITTNNLAGSMAMNKPLLSMPYVIYALLLVVAGVIAIGLNRLMGRVAVD
jgi:glycerophosphoryl diester phosphodiesterase